MDIGLRESRVTAQKREFVQDGFNYYNFQVCGITGLIISFTIKKSHQMTMDVFEVNIDFTRTTEFLENVLKYKGRSQPEMTKWTTPSENYWRN